MRYTDLNVSGRDSTFVQVPDSATGNPTDSLAVVRYFAGSFSSALDWDTGINLPFLLRGTWKIQPTIGVQNVTSGALRDPEPQHRRGLGSAGQARELQPVHDADLLRLLQRRLHPRAEPDAAQHQSADQLVVCAGGDRSRVLRGRDRAAGPATGAAEPAAERALPGAEPELRGEGPAGAGRQSRHDGAKVPPAEHPDEPDPVRLPAGRRAGRQWLGDGPGDELRAERPAARIQPRFCVRPVAGQCARGHLAVRALPHQPQHELRPFHRDVPFAVRRDQEWRRRPAGRRARRAC